MTFKQLMNITLHTGRVFYRRHCNGCLLFLYKWDSFFLFSKFLRDILYLAILSVYKCEVRTLKDKYESQMKKGVLDMLVLKLLEKQEKYGYQIISELKEKSNERFLLKEGTLYPILYRLEDDKYVESKWSEPEGKKVPRKYYRITEEGKRALQEITELWFEINSSAKNIMEEKNHE